MKILCECSDKFLIIVNLKMLIYKIDKKISYYERNVIIGVLISIFNILNWKRWAYILISIVYWVMHIVLIHIFKKITFLHCIKNQYSPSNKSSNIISIDE